MRTHACIAGFALAAALGGGVGGCEKGPTSSPALRLHPDSAVLALHESVQLRATVTGIAGGDTIVSFYSLDTTVVRVEDGGTLRAVGYGSAWVRGNVTTRQALADSVLVRVPAPAGPWLVLVPDSLGLPANGWAQLRWRVANVPEASPAVAFTSSDTAVLEARASGLLCPRQPGNAVVRASLPAYPAATDLAHVRILEPRGVEAPTTLSFQSVTDSVGKQVDYSAIRGTIHVTALMDAPPANPCRSDSLVLELMVDGKVLQQSGERPLGGRYTHTFDLDTRATDAGGQALLPNGAHVMTVRASSLRGVFLSNSTLAIIVAN